jgi:tetratricopeptide (TPR) repeat protein
MSLPPGLLPESDEPRASRASWVLGAVVFVALLAVIALVILIRDLTRERNIALMRLAQERAKHAEPATPVPAPEPRSAPEPVAPRSAPAAAPVAVEAPARPAPKVRVLPEDPEYLSRGLQEFRQGRYDQAERQFFRAIPESFLYLALTGLAQHNWREAVTFLARAMSTDPAWLRKVSPQDLFGSAAAFDGVVAALDDQISKNPLDADLKTLAAYLRYHEKGAAYAKALLVEAINANPDHEAAKAFLETLGP